LQEPDLHRYTCVGIIDPQAPDAMRSMSSVDGASSAMQDWTTGQHTSVLPAVDYPIWVMPSVPPDGLLMTPAMLVDVIRTMTGNVINEDELGRDPTAEELEGWLYGGDE
jgi:hypothetical protein